MEGQKFESQDKLLICLFSYLFANAALLKDEEDEW
jgi:hypothetical protein